MTRRGFLGQVYHNPLFRPLLLVLRTRMFSSMMGWIFRTPYSRYLIRPLVRLYGIDMQTYEVPRDGFSDVNDFFIRPSLPGYRIFPTESAQLGSPVDGCIEIFPRITDVLRMRVKGYDVNLTELFGSEIQDFRGGDVCFCRLRFSDYHRFHFFDDGRVLASVSREGLLYSVDQSVLSTGFWTQNKSHCMRVATKNFGDVLILEVGATNVGCITNHKKVGDTFSRGEEKGYFELGGSAVLLVFQSGSLVWNPDLLQKSRSGEEYELITGSPIAHSA